MRHKVLILITIPQLIIGSQISVGQEKPKYTNSIEFGKDGKIITPEEKKLALEKAEAEAEAARLERRRQIAEAKAKRQPQLTPEEEKAKAERKERYAKLQAVRRKREAAAINLETRARNMAVLGVMQARAGEYISQATLSAQQALAKSQREAYGPTADIEKGVGDFPVSQSEDSSEESGPELKSKSDKRNNSGHGVFDKNGELNANHLRDLSRTTVDVCYSCESTVIKAPGAKIIGDSDRTCNCKVLAFSDGKPVLRQPDGYLTDKLREDIRKELTDFDLSGHSPDASIGVFMTCLNKISLKHLRAGKKL